MYAMYPSRNVVCFSCSKKQEIYRICEREDPWNAIKILNVYKLYKWSINSLVLFIAVIGHTNRHDKFCDFPAVYFCMSDDWR